MGVITVKRYSVLTIGFLMVALVVLLAGCNKTSDRNNENNQSDNVDIVAMADLEQEGTSWQDASIRLSEGNQRYVDGITNLKDFSQQTREDLAEQGQKPFATIVCCSDSRVPPELIFDQGLGDLFVIRVAGNVVDSVALGSIEYGVEHLGTSLIVVLGHDHCGAVKATVDGGEVSENISSITELIRPAYERAKNKGIEGDIYTKCEDENILNTINAIKSSPVVAHLIEEKGMEIIGAKYHLERGVVTFLNY